MDHDQNFKNLILDYPRESLTFFAPAESASLATAEITPIRQEQLQARLGDRFRELDVPLLVEWPDGRREALLFVVEEETNPARFSVYRLAHYCLDLSQLMETDRVVPVVIFLQSGEYAQELHLGGDHLTYLSFRYLFCDLAKLEALDYFASANIVARLNLPNMRYDPNQKLRVYDRAVTGLEQLESNLERQAKYIGFIDAYADLDDDETEAYRQSRAEEVSKMGGLSQLWKKEGIEEGLEEGLERGRQEGHQAGLQAGLQAGECRVLIRQMTLKFGEPNDEVMRRLNAADAETLLRWGERLLSADSLDDVFKT